MGTENLMDLAIIIVLFFMGVKIVWPTHGRLIERLGKYMKFAQPSFHWIIIPTGTELVNIIGEMAGMMPVGLKKGREREKLSNEN